jgi:AraC-like DNA-binding protein
VNAVMTDSSTLYAPIPQPEFARSLKPGFDIRGYGGSQVDGSFEISDVGGMVVADIALTPVHVRWHPQASSGFPQIKVIFQETGTSMSAQDGRRSVARPGDIYFFDSGRPFALWTEGETHQHSIEFPRSLISDYLWRFTDLTALTIDGKAGPARFLRTFIKTLIDNSECSDQQIARRLRDHAVQLLLTAVWENFDCKVPSDRSQKAQLRRAKSYILERLDDSDLDVESIAAGLHMSVRYLYCLFETEGLTVARWIRQCRLDRCRRELEDQASAAISICQIALKNGFNDSAYFSTAFRAAYGVTPSDCRRTALGKPLRVS